MGYKSVRITCISAIHLEGTKVPPLSSQRVKKEKIEQDLDIYVLEKILLGLHKLL